jgi:hypothetical protein
MRRLIVAAVFLLSFAPLLLAAGWTKPYFALTKPGSFASYKTTSSVGAPSTLTRTRLADRDGQVVLDVYSEFTDNVTPPSTTRYELSKGFDVDRNLVDYMSGLTTMSMSAGKDAKFQPMPAAAISNITKMPTYAATAVFKGIETVDGKSCDHYSYVRDQTGSPYVESGDLWLTAAVPFGIVKHTTSTKDRSGKVAFTSETLLVSSGSKPLPASTMTAADDPTVKPMTIAAAYAAGLIQVDVEIAPADKRGDHLTLRIASTGKPLTLTLAAAPNTSLYVDSPFENLVFNATTAQKLTVNATTPATVVVNQVGTSRVVAGKFNIHMYEGKPLFQGSATMGFLK